MRRTKSPKKRKYWNINSGKPPDLGFGGHLPYPPKNCELRELIIQCNGLELIDFTRCVFYCPKYCDRYKAYRKEWNEWRKNKKNEKGNKNEN